MRPGNLLILCFWLAVSGGCATSRHEPVDYAPQAAPLPAASAEPYSEPLHSGPPYPAPRRQPALCNAMLFDARPGPYDATMFNYRSDWPSAPSYYSPGEVIFYRERFIDIQGHGIHSPGYVHRRFETYRTGVGYR